MIYVSGSLRNKNIPQIANDLARLAKEDTFADWFAAGPEADDYWKLYEESQGRDYISALKAPAAQNVFNFDLKHMDKSRGMMLVLPAGKSAHLELGVMRGWNRPTAILLDRPDRWDVMYNFVDLVSTDLEEIAEFFCTTRGATYV